MKKSILAVAIAIAFVSATPLAHADTTSTSTANGGAGGAGGSAAGGTATGGTSTNNISGVSSGGTGQGGAGGTAQGGTGGTAQASGGYVGSVSTVGSTASLGDVTVNLNQASAPMGKAGLGVGVDPTTGHIVTDNTVNYQGSYKVKNTPDVSVGGPASGPCNGFSGGIGVSMAGIGIGANASTVDEGCSARETARVAAMIGRMDVANAVLENLPIVQAAMKAKAAREASALPAQSLPAQSSGIPATTAPAHWPAAPVPVPAQSQEQRDAALKEQQRQAQEALQRQATMAKVNDTLKFTDATTQGNDKTPQEIMAEEANKKLAAKAEEAKKRQESLALAPQPSQQANRSDPPATGTPLALQQTIKPEIITKAAESKNSPEPQPASPKPSARSDVPTKVVDAKVSPAALSAEERLKATKAALNLQ
jgi:hypothetical protein